MKLLYITNGITGAGGLERVLSIKTSLLADRLDYEVHVLSLNEIGMQTFFSFSKNVYIHSIEVGGKQLSYFLQYKKGIQKIVDQVGPDVISVCDDALKGFFLPKIIRTKAKWVYESHASMILSDRGQGLPIIKKLHHRLKQLLGKGFSKIILLTEGNRKEWSLNNLVVISNPLPFQTTEISSLKNKKIIAVGSYSYNKGYDLLLRIWAELGKDFPDWELNIYGEGTIENLKSVSGKLLLRNIHFHNPVPNIEDYYADSSIFVLPSRSEGFGMVLIEAMSCHLPVISFDCPNGPRDIISHNKDGFLIENGNVEEFVEKVALLINNFKLRQQMGKEAMEKSKKYEATAIMKQWDDLFKYIAT